MGENGKLFFTAITFVRLCHRVYEVKLLRYLRDSDEGRGEKNAIIVLRMIRIEFLCNFVIKTGFEFKFSNVF